MNVQLEIETKLHQQLKRTAKKSAARKYALKQLEKAHKIASQELELAKITISLLEEQIKLLKNKPWWKF